jgi:hypothetical protein
MLANAITALTHLSAATVGIWVAALLTLVVLSYVVGDNPLFRLAQYALVGLAAGYAVAVAWSSVLWPRLCLLWADPAGHWPYALFFALGILLLARAVRPVAGLARLPLAVLIGTGAGLGLGAALTGSLLPQLSATIASVSPADYGSGWPGWAAAIDAALLVLGTMAVLSVFHFTAKGRGWVNATVGGAIRALGVAGRPVMMIALGALLAGALITFFAILRSRIDFLYYDWLARLIGMG